MHVRQSTTETRQRTSRHHVTGTRRTATSRRSFPSFALNPFFTKASTLHDGNHFQKLCKYNFCSRGIKISPSIQLTSLIRAFDTPPRNARCIVRLRATTRLCKAVFLACRTLRIHPPNRAQSHDATLSNTLSRAIVIVPRRQ
jgi:hypothetical protein